MGVQCLGLEVPFEVVLYIAAVATAEVGALVEGLFYI